jgi:hypothetical protein
MKSSLIVLGMLIAIVTAPPAKAQMTLDVSKITCRQFLRGEVGASIRSVANWLSGFYEMNVLRDVVAASRHQNP